MNVLRSKCRQFFYTSRYLRQSATIVPAVKDTPTQQDKLTSSIKSATNPNELFEIISNRRKDLSLDDALNSLKILFSIQKSGNNTCQSSDIIKNPDFELICRKIKRNARSLSLNDAIEALKILFFMDVPANSAINFTLLNLIRNQINDISFGHIIFLEFLLRKTESTPLVEALKIAMPMLLQIQIGTKMDHDNVSQNIDLLQFVSRNRVSEQCITSIVTALTLHGENLNPEEARSIIWSLTDLKSFHSNYEKLLKNSINVFSKSLRLNEQSFEMVESTLSKMINKFLSRHNAFYHETFYNDCVNYILKNDSGFTNGIYIQKKFNKIGFINIQLLDYLVEKIHNDPGVISTSSPTQLLTLINSLSIANYKPKQFDQLKPILLENLSIFYSKNDLPWVRFALELASLDLYDHKLLEKIFSENYLETFLSRDYNDFDYLMLLTLHQCVNLLCPEYEGCQLNQMYVDRATEILNKKQNFYMKEIIDLAFGGQEFVYHGLKTKWGNTIDYAVILDSNGNPVQCPYDAELEGAMLERIEVKDECKMVGILIMSKGDFALNVPRLKGVSELKIKMLAKLGVPIVPINVKQWTELIDKEKLAYIQQEVRHKLLL